MGEPGQRPHSYGNPAQYQGSAHPSEPRRSSIQSVLNPSTSDPAYGYYQAQHGAPPPSHHPQHLHSHVQQQQPYLHTIKQPPPPASQQQQQLHHHQQQQPSNHSDQYHLDERQYPPQSYHYQQPLHAHQPQLSHQHPQHAQQPQQQHHHVQQQQQSHISHHHPQQSPGQQQPYYSSQAPSSSSLPSSGSTSNLAYPTSASSLPTISNQSQFRSYSQYAPGSSSSEPSFQTPPASAIQGPPSQTSLHSHHHQQQLQQSRHVSHGSIGGSGPGPGANAHPHPSHASYPIHSERIPIPVGNGSGSMTHGAPRRTSGESVMDMRLQSPPANPSHYGHTSSGHLPARAPSPRASASELSRSRQPSVSGNGFHGDYRSHTSEAPTPGTHHEYPHRYPASYQDPSLGGSHHATALQQQQQQQHQQQQQLQHASHHQHPQYASQFSQHPSPAYARSAASEVDRPHPHGVPPQQHYNQGYPPQSSSPTQHSQPPLISPHRGSMQDIHSGGSRTAAQSQLQQQHVQRSHAEIDEDIVMNFMSELQLKQQQQQSHGHNPTRKPMPPPLAPPVQPATQQHHIQQQQQQQHHYHHQQPQQQQPLSQQQQPPPYHHHMHGDHPTHHPSEPQQHARYGHGDQLGYQHSQEPQSSVHRQPPTAAQPTVEMSRAMTPPNLGHPSIHVAPKGAAAETRQRSMSSSAMGPASPVSVSSPSYPIKPADSPSKKLSTSGSQPSLLPPRSQSLINILNVEEMEVQGETAETEEAEDSGMIGSGPEQHVSEDRAYVGQNLPYSYQREPPGHEHASMNHPKLMRSGHLEVQPGTSDNPSVGYHPEIEQVEQRDEESLSIMKASKDKVARPVKEREQKEKPAKAATEKVTKDKVEKAEKVEKIDKAGKVDKPKKDRMTKMPPKKKTFVSNAMLPGLESTETTADAIADERSFKPSQLLQEPTAGQKHTIDEMGSDLGDTTIKKTRVDDRLVLGGEVGALPARVAAPNQRQDEPSLVSISSVVQPLNSPRSASSSRDDVRVMTNGTPVIPSSLPDQRSVRVQEEIPRQITDASTGFGHPGMSGFTDITADVKTGVTSGSKGASAMTARSRSSTPTSGSLASRYRLQPEDELKDPVDRNKKTSNDDSHTISPTTSLPREPSKASKQSSGGPLSTVKDKKPTKKRLVAETLQAEEVTVPNKVSKNHGVSPKEAEDVEMEAVETKISLAKPVSAGKKATSSAVSQGSGFKKRFSQPAEDLSSTSENSKNDEAIKPAVPGIKGSTPAHNRIPSAESARDKSNKSDKPDKPTKQKRADRIVESTPIAGVKSEGPTKSQQMTSRPKESATSPNNSRVANKEEQPSSRETAEHNRAETDEHLYCICKTPYDPSRFMIACDGGCDDWFHGDCVGVAEKDSDMVDKYYCKRCQDEGRHARKKSCFRESCQKPAARKSKYCSKECGLLVATQRIHESQARVFGSLIVDPAGEHLKSGDIPAEEEKQQHLQRRRRLTLADLDDRQRLLSIREKVAHVHKACAVLDEREKQLAVCMDRQARQEFGKLSSPGTFPSEKEDEKTSAPTTTAAAEDEDEESVATPKSSSTTKSKTKGGRGQKAKDDKDKEVFCGFDYSLVWDDVLDMSRMERAAAEGLTSSSLATTPAGSRASSVAPPSFGVVLVNSKKDNGLESGKPRTGAAAGSKEKQDTAGNINGKSSPQLEDVGQHVCMSKRQCDRHVGWQKLKAAELDLEKTLQNKLLKSLKAEAKLVKNRMKRRRNDLSAGILNGTIEH